MRKQKGFTLAELLVVIAIIGLLSSIVLVATRETTERAKIAAVLQFSAQVHHALGAYAVGIWDFDEGTGTTTKDTSGNGNNGTLYSGVTVCSNPPTAGCPTWKCASADSENTPSRQGCSLEFDGSNDYVDLGSNNVLNLTSDLTISAWIKTTTITKRQAIYDRSKQEDGTHYGIVFSIKGYNASDGQISYYSDGCLKCVPQLWGGWHSSTSTITFDKWHFVVVAVDADKGGQFYINGNNAGTWQNPDSDHYSGASSIDHNAEIGRDYQVWNNIFKGLIDDVRIYSEALTQAQIKKLYVEGARKKGLLTKD